jgi:4-carboxymuconolactone decarboxylase
LLRDHAVTEATYAHTVDALGEADTVELVVLLGYYSTVSMVLNVFDVRIPSEQPPVVWD